MEPSPEDRSRPLSPTERFLEHVRRRSESQQPPAPVPAPESAPQDDLSPVPPEAPLPEEGLTRQQRCSHPASMVKRFADGVTYCRLCYAYLGP